MGTPALQSLTQQGQVYYDADTGQYYTQSSQRNNNPMAALFGLNRNTQRNYLNNFNNQSMTAKPVPQFTPIDMAALFPELYQSAQGMQGDSQASAGLLGGQGAAQSASSGAGRFM
jgi:hypothetical protein